MFPASVLGEGTDAISLEDKIKAAFIYNFTKYIEWVDDDTTDSFEIGIIGDSDIISPLLEIAARELVNNRKIEIIHFQDIQDFNSCNILYISASEADVLPDILKNIDGRNILTISGNTGFALKGVAINFVIIDGKIRFEININLINQTGVLVNSHLLKLAILVEDEGISGD